MSLLSTLRDRWFGEPAALPLPEAGDFETRRPPNADRIVRLRLRRPIIGGSVVVIVLVFGLLIWAAIFSISGAVVSPGVVQVENNLKDVKTKEGGVIRRILVHEGQKVRAGQELIRFDRVQSQAGVDIYEAGYDTALAEIARFQAEASGAAAITVPKELAARASDPSVAALLASQRALFLTRMTLYRSQAEVLRSQAEQLGTQIQGMQAQMAATDSQSSLIDDELGSTRDLNKLGYAPSTRLLALERNAAAIKGQRGSLLSDMARTRQAIGDIRIQIAQLDEKRESDAAQGIRDAQARLSEALPKLRATEQSLDETVVRAPTGGYVFNLTQFTEGGVAQPTETLMQIVPTDTPLLITAQVRPNDIAEVHIGMPARVTLTAYNPRTTPQVDGTVTLVSADAATDPQTKASYYQVRVRIDPKELAKAGPQVRLTPGMPATVAIITSQRTVMDYLLGPMTEAMRTALTEK